jgi:NitT/TauT family transport system substrate-binding protein
MARTSRRRFLQGGLVVAGVGLLSAHGPTTSAAVTRGPVGMLQAPGSGAGLDPPLDPPVTVRVGRVVGSSTEAGQIVALERGYFARQGIQVEYVEFDSAARMIPSLGTGQLDVGGGTVSAGLYNAVARGIAVKMVGSQSRHDPGASSLYLMVRRDLIESGAVASYADLRGRQIATPARGIITDFIAARALAQAGLQLADAELVEMSFPDMILAFANRMIDAALQVEPAATQAVRRGVAVKWREAAEVRPGVQAAVVAYSPQFAQRTDIARRWMIAYLQGVRDYTDAFTKNLNRAEIVGILTRQTAVTDPSLYDQMGFSYIDPNGRVSEDSLVETLEWFTQQGFVSQTPNLRDALDLSFADFAVDRLGWYT